MLCHNGLDSRYGLVALNQTLVFAQELHPRTSVLAADVFERRAAAAVRHDEKLRTGPDEQLHEVEVGLAGPARVVEGGATAVVDDAGGDAGLGEEVVNGAGEAPAAGHVEEGFAEAVGGLEGPALGAVQGAEGVEILAADGRNGLGVVRIVVSIAVLQEVVLEGEGGHRLDRRVLGLQQRHEVPLGTSATARRIRLSRPGACAKHWRGTLTNI